FNRLRPEIKSQMVPATTSLTGFSGETIWPLGQLRLLVTIGDATHSTKAWMNFMVVKSMSPYDVEGGIATIRSTFLIPTECASEVVIGGSLSDKGRTELCSVLKKNLDIFAWKPSDMIGVPRSVAEHRLNIREGYTPVRQKKRGQAPERARAIQAEVQKLVDAEIMMEVYYHDWLSNPVMVYVDDLGVKSHTEAEIVRDIEETFRTIRKINMKLNPKKCSFGLAKGVFLGYVITPEGIKPCPNKTAAVLQLPLPQTVKEVQSLNGKLASLNSPDDEKRNNSNADLLHKPGVTGSGAKLFANGEIGSVTSLCSKEAPTVFSGSPYHGDVPQAAPAAAAQEESWTLFTDGSSCVDGIGAGLILTNAEGVNIDSKLVANQVLGTYVAKEDNMIKYLEIVKGLVSGFTTFSISQVPRSKNKQADALSKIASTSFAHLSKQVLVEVLENKSIKEKEVAAVIKEDGPTWMTQIADYLKEGILPRDNKEARKLRLKARPFPEGPGKVKFLIVAMDYFTKWVEAKAVATITGEQVKRFVWDNIVCRFGIPGEIISYNGKQFADNPFKDWCDKLNITQRFSSVKHPQSNGLVERANQSLREGIKARLGEEIGMPTYCIASVDVVNNDKELRLNLDLLEERREHAAICEARAKSKMMKYYNSRVRGVAFKPVDFVYRSIDASHAVAGGKLGPKWEGPYEVTEALGNEAYKLRFTDGTVLPRTWNVTNIKRCYL
nr:reverse transcriptase domain-containing protein [Tanacetum cinerariifolium]